MSKWMLPNSVQVCYIDANVFGNERLVIAIPGTGDVNESRTVVMESGDHGQTIILAFLPRRLSRGHDSATQRRESWDPIVTLQEMSFTK